MLFRVSFKDETFTVVDEPGDTRNDEIGDGISDDILNEKVGGDGISDDIVNEKVGGPLPPMKKVTSVLQESGQPDYVMDNEAVHEESNESDIDLELELESEIAAELHVEKATELEVHDDADTAEELVGYGPGNPDKGVKRLSYVCVLKQSKLGIILGPRDHLREKRVCGPYQGVRNRIDILATAVRSANNLISFHAVAMCDGSQ
ncbi:hypothetical protein SARC_01359 [Sphaeroforma arctica JP610]|uniref:Uncharacterized protein n=1 Tax=Sphaeroforma arctica JP610 TaxID=667725 RepID=A0A0L0GDZ9_9EUKA|nr:hypothetical protein SARC_01359 [Sphaeroforma arctica JP610]KNC86488.1 hypothetical protein SARC_01359 [Sphaeroforma arctica JP610]|eukprot:XP_014160390.1 hypothetical protein SARC_01359 [Sphaeroforma arctica JP610]